MKIACRNCEILVDTPPSFDPTNAAAYFWCGPCLLEHEDLLIRLGVIYHPAKIEQKELGFQFIDKKNIALLKTIPAKKKNPAVIIYHDELAGAKSVSPTTSAVLMPIFCKLKYYGIACQCVKCVNKFLGKMK